MQLSCSFWKVLPKQFTALPFKWAFSAAAAGVAGSAEPAPRLCCAQLRDANLTDRWPLWSLFPVKDLCAEKHFSLSLACLLLLLAMRAFGIAEQAAPGRRQWGAGVWAGGALGVTRRDGPRVCGAPTGSAESHQSWLCGAWPPAPRCISVWAAGTGAHPSWGPRSFSPTCPECGPSESDFSTHLACSPGVSTGRGPQRAASAQ